MSRLVEGLLRVAQETFDLLGAAGAEVAAEAKTHDISTKADLSISQAQIRWLKEQGVACRYVDEETGIVDIVQKPELLVVVDDIDGTYNWRRGKGKLPFCTMVCVFDRLEPRFGDALAAGVRDLRTGETWFAERGKGTTYNGKAVKASGVAGVDKKTHVYFDHYGTPEVGIYTKIHKLTWGKDLGSNGLGLCWVADGTFDAFVGPLNPWEACAGYLLVTEAGGWFGDFEGKPYRDVSFVYTMGRLQTVAAATLELGKRLAGLLKGF